jgi:hypothetical protein
VHGLYDGTHLVIAAHDPKSQRDLGVRHEGRSELDGELVAIAQGRAVVGLGMAQRCRELSLSEHHRKRIATFGQEAFVRQVRVVENSRKKHNPGGVDVLKSNVDRNLKERWARFEKLLAIDELHDVRAGYPSLLRGVDLAATVRPPPMREKPSATSLRLARRSLGLLALAGLSAGCPSGGNIPNPDEHLAAQSCAAPEIFAEGCEGALCHTPQENGQVTGVIDLISVGFEHDLIDRPSDYSAVDDPSACPPAGTELIIDTADPEASLIITKTAGGHACGLPMPPPGYPPLGAAAIECIRAWAQDLALSASGADEAGRSPGDGSP